MLPDDEQDQDTKPVEDHQDHLTDEDDRRESRRMLMQAADYSFIGIEFGVGAALGFYAGRWLDERFGWAPWGVTVMVLLGLSVAVRDLIRLAMKMKREEES